MNTPDLQARLALREDPRRFPAGHQHWNHLLFLHWRVDPALLQASLPRGLYVDTFQQEAWLGVVPFFMERIRPSLLPPLPWLSWFLELNVRTYVHDDAGRPGVWFYSLDCNQPVAVALARRFFHLPYFRAAMSAQQSGKNIAYSCQRRGSEKESRYAWQAHGKGLPAAPGSLEFFLAERYLLFTSDSSGALYSGRVHHAPYQLYDPDLSLWDAGPAEAAGFPVNAPPDSVLAAERVDVRVFPLERIS